MKDYTQPGLGEHSLKDIPTFPEGLLSMCPHQPLRMYLLSQGRAAPAPLLCHLHTDRDHWVLSGRTQGGDHLPRQLSHRQLLMRSAFCAVICAHDAKQPQQALHPSTGHMLLHHLAAALAAGK